MMDHPRPTAVSEGVLRKLVIVALLGFGVWAADRLLPGMIGTGQTSLLGVGFALIAAFTLGQLAVGLRLPAITGYLVAGVLLGESLRTTLPAAWMVPPLSWPILGNHAIDLLSPFQQVAVGLIALTAGGLLRLDALRGLARPIGGIFGGHALSVLVIMALWATVQGLGLPYVTVPGLAGVGTTTVLGFGAVLAGLCLSGSPAATLAVLHGTGARGPVARVVLANVALKEVGAVAVVVAALHWMARSPGTSWATGPATQTSLHMGLGLAAGVLVGGAMSLYVHQVRREVSLFVLGVVVLVTFITNRFGMSPVWVLLPAGMVLASSSDHGEKLVREVVKLSTPLYLLVFAMLGAAIRLDLVIGVLPHAIAIVLLRAAALRVGVAAGGRMGHADPNVVRYAWAGFVPQGGVAVSLVLVAESSMGALGDAIVALTAATLVLNELAGPAIFRHMLGRAGELPASAVRGQEVSGLEPQEAVPDEAPPSARGVKPWTRKERPGNPWGKPPKLASPELNRWLGELEADMQALSRDVVSGRLEAFRKDAHAYLRQLRMELLRHHRRVSNRMVTSQESGGTTSDAMRVERSELAERWGAAVLARGARIGSEKWLPTQILDAVDQIVEDAPEFVEAPYESVSFEHPGGESTPRALLRMGLRVRRRWASFTDGTEPTRSVAMGTLVRYHLVGKLPAQVEGVAALLIDAERQLVDRTRDLFDAASHGYLELTQLFPQGGDDPELRSHLAALRRSFEEEIAAAIKEVSVIVEDGDARTATILGAACQTIKHEASVMSTLDLPNHARRFSRVHGERERARKRLMEGFAQARQVNASQYSLLALELEMGSLEGHIEDAVHTFASDLRRSLDGRAHHQLVRITAALEEAIQRYETTFDANLNGEDLAAAIREEAQPLERVVSEAVRASLLLRDQITNEHVVTPLLDNVARASRALTDRYKIPSGRPARGDWRIPPSVPVVEVPFRRLVQDHVEAHVSPKLVHLMRELAASVQPTAAAVEELDRRISFNVEVAVAEVEEYQNEPVPLETRTLVREMILGAWQRSRARLAELQGASASWGEDAQNGVHHAVVGGLEELRWQLVEGKVVELRSRLARGADGRLWLERARRLPSLLKRGKREVRSIVRAAVGGNRIEKTRRYLGLPAPEEDALVEPNAFARAPGALEHLPLVYRRLFSAQALEAGDLLVGRTDSIQRARRVLSGIGAQHLRAVALLGPDGVGKGAVANAIVRGVDGAKPESWTFQGPTTVQEVERWFATPRERRIITVGGFHWLVSARPGGIEPLRRFVAGVVADAGRNAWLLRADSLVWDFAATLSPIRDAFPTVVDLEPFDVEQLEAAVLARHGMSGYELAFGAAAQGGFAWELSRRLLGNRTRQAWFRDLHEASGGLIRDALQLWMASVNKVDEDGSVVRMGPVPSPPLAALRQLPEDALLTLWQISRNGWTDPDIHASLFRTTREQAEAHLARLVHWGLLHSSEGRYRIVVPLRGAVVRVMEDRRWVA
jgi:Kef-type K+ transport system membrane component KefB